MRPDRAESPRRSVTIVSTDLTTRRAVTKDSTSGQYIVDLGCTVGSIVHWPMPAEQWYITKINERWVLDRRVSTQNLGLTAEATVGDSVWYNPSGDIIIKDANGPVGKDPGLNALTTLGTNPLVAAGLGQTSFSLSSANNCQLTLIRASRNMTITQMVWQSAGSSGNYDIGIYSSTGARMRHMSSNNWPGAGVVTEVLPTPVSLKGGQTYYTAFAGDNTSGALRAMVMLFNNSDFLLDGSFANYRVGGSFPLPTSIDLSGPPAGATGVPLIFLRED